MIIEKRKYEGKITIPSSKSQTIRALLIAAFADGVSIIRHPLYSSDTLSALNAIKSMGVKVKEEENGDLIIDPSEAFQGKESIAIDAGNSGTTEYLALPMLSTLSLPVTIDGDEQLRRRPASPLISSLKDLGAMAEGRDGFPPITVKGPLEGGDTTIECRTSQYYSGLLLAAPMARKSTHIKCSLLYEKPYVEMTLDWLKREGIKYKISEDLEEAWIEGGQQYRAFDSYIEGDFSSATFFFALAAIQKTSITVSGLDFQSHQGDKAVLDILEKMGCLVRWNGMEVCVTGPEKLKGGAFDLNAIPDSLPALAVVAAASEEEVRLENVPQARIKETDRIEVMRKNLERMGVSAEERRDGLIIRGMGKLKGNKVMGYGDHRVIMAMAIAATVSEGITEIDDTSAAAVTFPDFFKLLSSLEA